MARTTTTSARRRGDTARPTEAPQAPDPRRGVRAPDGSAQAEIVPPTRLQTFLNQASRYELLTAAEEIALAKRIERGDVDAKDRMINANLRLVVSHARRYQGTRADAARPDPGGHARADPRGGEVRLAQGLQVLDVRDAVDPSEHPARAREHLANDPPSDAHQQRERRLARVERDLTAKLSHDPSDEEVAAAADMTVADVLALREARRHVTSLDVPIGDDGDSNLGDLVGAIARSERRGAVERARAHGRGRPRAPDRRGAPRRRAALRAARRPRALDRGDEPRETSITRDRARQLEEAAMRSLEGEAALAGLREAA